MQGKKHYTEKLFTSFQLSDHIPADNFYRCLKDSLNFEWLYQSTKSYYGTEGQKSIDPVREGFVFDQENDRYTCMAKGVHLPYKKTYQDKKGYYKKQYRSSAKDCSRCPLKTSCIGGRADYKKIEETVDKPLYDQMHARLQSSYAPKMKKLRQSTVEPVLGTLINFMGLRRIWTRGIKNANKFMLGAAIAYNLKKWMNYQQQKRTTAVMGLKKGRKKPLFLVFFVMDLYHAYQHQSQKML